MSVMLLRSRRTEGEPTPAGECVSMRAANSVCCPPSLCRRTLASSRCRALSNGRDIRTQGVDLRFAFSRCQMTPQAVAIIRRRMYIQHQIAKGTGRDAFK